MGEVVYLKRNEAYTNSLMIAEGTENQHRTVQRLIQKYESDFAEFGQVRFEMRAVKYARGTNQQKVYLLNEEQATLLLTYMKNTDKIRQFKKRLVAEFYAMRLFILERNTDEWLESRKSGKTARRNETDEIKHFVEYAKLGGSNNAEWYYRSFSDLANKSVGITDRNSATIYQLNQLTMVENIILNQIRAGIEAEMYYKDIYKQCKAQVELFKNVAYIGSK